MDEIQSYVKALEIALVTKLVTYAAERNMQLSVATVSILLFPSTLDDSLKIHINNILGHKNSDRSSAVRPYVSDSI